MKYLKSRCVILLHHLLRVLERRLPMSLLLMVCIPLAGIIAVFTRPREGVIQVRYRKYLNKILLVFSGHLAEPKWLERCEVEISDECSEDLKSGKPIVFLFVHEGTFKIIPYWLRAQGIRVSAIMKSHIKRRKFHRLERDKRDIFPEQKVIWGRDELKGFCELLNQGGSLLIAVDTRLGKTEDFKLPSGEMATVPTGPFRIAKKYDASVYPCGLVSRGNWKFHLRVGDKYCGDKVKLLENTYACYDM